MQLTRLRNDALDIFRAGLEAVDPVQAVRKHLQCQDDRLKIVDRTYHLSAYKDVYIIGAGKASAATVQHLEKILGDLLITGSTYTNVMDLRLAMVG